MKTRSETCSAWCESVPSDTCNDIPPQTTRLGKRLARMRWRLSRVMCGDFCDQTCTMVPAYTGGGGRPVAVDGKLRTPACFGSRGEPWAWPLGTGRACDPDYEDTALVFDPRRGHLVFVEIYA